MRKSEQQDPSKKTATIGRLVRLIAFPSAVVLAYALLWLLSPAHGLAALKASCHVCRQIAPALCIAFAVMVTLNMLVKPVHVKRLLGKATKARGVVLSTSGGILSMGPIYAWYPLLKEFRVKGASDFHIANFLCCRAVKPPLLPFVVAYFGWFFTIVLTVFMVASSLLTAFVVNHANRNPGD